MDAILVGIGTALADDPLLTARPAGSRIATRIVIDSNARLPLDSQLVKTVAQAPVVVITTPQAASDRIEKLRAAGVETLVIDSDADAHPSLALVAKELGRRCYTNVLVEGGSAILGGFFDIGLIDEIHAFIAPKLVGGLAARTPLAGVGLDFVPVEASLDAPTVQLLDGDVYLHGRIRREA